MGLRVWGFGVLCKRSKLPNTYAENHKHVNDGSVAVPTEAFGLEAPRDVFLIDGK